ncbi:uncharacterized protein LOC131876480 [Cryptomeria japonica]|uniref:uncharacterized protein LOC131876480 n=1 Tax=Cryptomeria japonica TaxID=3369 RepID=UPI0027DA6D4F|nr:uncharacterized protein LOC131876480 [Cryptomeria japonica]
MGLGGGGGGGGGGGKGDIGGGRGDGGDRGGGGARGDRGGDRGGARGGDGDRGRGRGGGGGGLVLAVGGGGRTEEGGTEALHCIFQDDEISGYEILWQRGIQKLSAKAEQRPLLTVASSQSGRIHTRMESGGVTGPAQCDPPSGDPGGGTSTVRPSASGDSHT